MRPERSLETKQVAVCLLLVAIALIVMGFVSDTLARHVAQAIPALLAFLIIPRWPAAGVWAAIGVLGVLFLAMAAVLAYLLGLSDLASGAYSNVEFFLTIVIAGCSAHAMHRVATGFRQGSALKGVVALAGGVAAQGAAMAISLLLFG